MGYQLSYNALERIHIKKFWTLLPGNFDYWYICLKLGCKGLLEVNQLSSESDGEEKFYNISIFEKENSIQNFIFLISNILINQGKIHHKCLVNETRYICIYNFSEYISYERNGMW